jgi:hypothetical protein
MAGADGSFTEGWLDKLPQDLEPAKGSISKFKSVTDLAKSYHHLESMLGKRSNAVVPPTELSTPEEVSAFRKALGIPETSDKYGLKPEQMPEGFEWDPQFEKMASDLAHKNNIPPSAMKEMVGLYMSIEQAKAQEMESHFEAELKSGEQALRKVWPGEAFDKNLLRVTAVAKTIGLDPESPGLRDPNVVLALHRISDLMSEDKFAAAQMAGATAQGGSMRAKDIMTNPQNPLYQRYQKGDPDVAKMVEDLLLG